MCEEFCQGTIICQQKQPFRIGVEASDRFQMTQRLREQIEDAGATAFIVGSNDYAPGFMQNHIIELVPGERLAVDFQSVFVQVDHMAEISNGLAVHTHQTITDIIVGLAPGSQSAKSQGPIEPE